MKKLIVALFGKRAKKDTVDLKNIKTVLLKPIGDAVGDAVVHISHLAQIKKAYPKVKTAVFVTERNRTLFELADCVDQLFDDSPISYLMQRGKWDLYLDFLPSFTSRSIFLDFLLNPKIIINFGKVAKKHYSFDNVKNYDFTTVIPDHTHIADYLHHSVLASYLSDESADVHLPLSEEQQKSAERYWPSDKKLRILLNPQGSGRALPAEELVDLLKRIDERYLKDIAFLLTHTKTSEQYIQNLKCECDVNLAPQTNMSSYCALVNSADIVVAVDGGGVHIACAYGKPLLSFYANNAVNLGKWYPRVKPQVEAFTVIADKVTDDNNETQGFSLNDAGKWLNGQIAKKLEN